MEKSNRFKKFILRNMIKSGKIMQAYNMFGQKNANLFLEVLNENGKNIEFIEQGFNKFPNSEENKKLFLNAMARAGINEVKNQYGEKISQRMKRMYENGIMTWFDFQQIVQICGSEEQEDIINKFLDLYENGKTKVGIHRTGGFDGKVICNEGLKLTGHLSSGAPGNIDKTLDDLDLNISFEKHVGQLIRDTAVGGNYKNFGQEYVDIVIVAIPEMAAKLNSDIIIKDDDSSRSKLNPKYILGFCTVNSKTNTIESFTKNEKYIYNAEQDVTMKHEGEESERKQRIENEK